MKNLLIIILAFISTISTSIAQINTTQQLIDEYVNTLPENAEVAIGLIQDGKMTTQGYQKKNGTIIAIDNATHIFEIGSISKTYTAALLLDQVQKGQMKLDDPFMKFISPKEKIATAEWSEVTLKQLITHTSGLAVSPKSYLKPSIIPMLFDKGNPYKNIQWKHFKKYLEKGTLVSPAGKKWTYNNSAYGLLGHLIAEKENTTWEDLLQERIFDELGMQYSYPTGKNVPAHLFVQGRDASGQPSGYWDMNFINPAGSIKSCAQDQLIWLSAHLNASHNSIFTKMKNHYNIEAVWKNTFSGNAWFHQITDHDHIIWHGGASGAFRSFSAFNDKEKTAIVILTNFNHNHPQMRNKDRKSQIKIYGFKIQKSLSSTDQVLSAEE